MRIRIRDLFDPRSGIQDEKIRIRYQHPGKKLRNVVKTGKTDLCTLGILTGGKLSFAGCHPDYEEGSSYSDADYTRDQRVLNDL
jgi:hypothetical protein